MTDEEYELKNLDDTVRKNEFVRQQNELKRQSAEQSRYESIEKIKESAKVLEDRMYSEFQSKQSEMGVEFNRNQDVLGARFNSFLNNKSTDFDARMHILDGKHEQAETEHSAELARTVTRWQIDFQSGMARVVGAAQTLEDKYENLEVSDDQVKRVFATTTTDRVMQGDSRLITSNAVAVTVGNIEALLESI